MSFWMPFFPTSRLLPSGSYLTRQRVLNPAHDTSLEAGLAPDGHAYEKLRDSHDYKEGADAFFEKRRPDYRGD